MYTNSISLPGGFAPTTKNPLDDRLLVATLAELIATDTITERASGYYKGMFARVLFDAGEYMWDVDTDDPMRVGEIAGGYTYPSFPPIPTYANVKYNFFRTNTTVTGEDPTSIKTKYELNADTNAFTDAEKVKVTNLPADTTGALATKATTAEVLIKTNTTPYTPTLDYHPATLKSIGDIALLKSVYDTLNEGKVGIAKVAEEVAWLNVTGKPVVFTPDTHVHAQSQVTGLEASLLSKADKYNNITNSAATSYTFILTDAFKYIRFTAADPVEVIIPTDASVAFEISTEITVVRAGTGSVTLAVVGGVTLNNAKTTLLLRARYSSFTIKKIFADEWDVVGDFDEI
jgi:hypothetical protein